MAGLYLHIPFCTKRCVYCDFYFVTTRGSHASFVRALIQEIEHYAAEYGPREPVETIYFGGGTPSLLHADDVSRILEAIGRGFDTAPLCEVTLEMNPDDAGAEHLRSLRSAGVDRLSVGVQSFFADDLAFMNRSHSELQARQVVDEIRKAGFDRFSVDLIFGLPEQPPEYWAANLERAVALEVPHLSTYSLTIEPRTVLHNRVERGLVTPADDDEMSDRYRFTMDYLGQRGYEHYEISSFALPGHRSIHNARYWEHANYLGFGPSAHSFWWTGLPARRWANVRNLKAYEALLTQRSLPLEFRENLDLDTLANEYLMLALRTSDGVQLDLLEERYGVDLLEDRLEELAWMEEGGFIHPIRNGQIRLTDSGKTICDAITAKILLDDESAA